MSNPVRAKDASAEQVGNAIKLQQPLILGEGPTYIPEQLSEEGKKLLATLDRDASEDAELIRSAMLIEENRPFKTIKNNEHLLARFEELYQYLKQAGTDPGKKFLHKACYAVAEHIRQVEYPFKWKDKFGREHTEMRPLSFTKDPQNPNWRDAWLDEFLPPKRK